MPIQQVYLIRHGETEWSVSGQHTGTTDILLTENGRRVARRLQPVLTKESFALVLTSPLRRARETCELAGLGEYAEIDRDLMEWNYGDYEGLTPQQIYANRPGWMVFTDGCPGGESPEQVGARVDRVIARVRGRGHVALFAHGMCSEPCGEVCRTARSGWMYFTPRYGDAEHLELISGHPRRVAVYCSARPVRHSCFMKLKMIHRAGK
jgi:probable phosphoglycerate mutase